MKAIIDLVLLGILVICTWNGYKKGLIMGIGGILCVIIAIYGANLLANTFYHDVVPALKPFANGYTESLGSKDSAVMREMGWSGSSYSVEDLLKQEPERKEEFFRTCYQHLGLNEATAKVMAEKAELFVQETGSTAWAALGQTLCDTVSYVGCFILAFLMIAIILTVLGNLPNLSFKLPGLDLVNDISGAVLGLVTGLLYCIVLVWVLKFMGKIIGSDTLESTKLGAMLLHKDFLLKYLGI